MSTVALVSDYERFRNATWCAVLLIIMLVIGTVYEHGETRPPESSGIHGR